VLEQSWGEEGNSGVNRAERGRGTSDGADVLQQAVPLSMAK
jgi:hypothetical protein